MPFNTFNSVAKLPKKGRNLPSITFSNPSLVTTTTHWVTDASYRVFLIEGSNGSSNINAKITNLSSDITIYYLIIGSGGTGADSYQNTYGGGGGGGGGFLDGSANIPGGLGVMDLSFSVPIGGDDTATRPDAFFSIINTGLSTKYFFAAAGSGSCGGMASIRNVDNCILPTGTGNVVKTIKGNGGGGSRINPNAGSYSSRGFTGGTPGGANGNETTSGGGGGSGGAASGRNGGVGSTVSSTTLGIKQKFGSNTFCAGGQGAIGGTSYGTTGVGLYGGGGGGTAYNISKGEGKKGAIAIAISMNDVPL